MALRLTTIRKLWFSTTIEHKGTRNRVWSVQRNFLQDKIYFCSVWILNRWNVQNKKYKLKNKINIWVKIVWVKSWAFLSKLPSTQSSAQICYYSIKWNMFISNNKKFLLDTDLSKFSRMGKKLQHFLVLKLYLVSPTVTTTKTAEKSWKVFGFVMKPQSFPCPQICVTKSASEW